jgi:hypothetical protein
VPFDALNGVMPPSGQVNVSAPLSVEKTTIALSPTEFVQFLQQRTDGVVEWRHSGFRIPLIKDIITY